MKIYVVYFKLQILLKLPPFFIGFSKLLEIQKLIGIWMCQFHCFLTALSVEVATSILLGFLCNSWNEGTLAFNLTWFLGLIICCLYSVISYYMGNYVIG